LKKHEPPSAVPSSSTAIASPVTLVFHQILPRTHATAACPPVYYRSDILLLLSLFFVILLLHIIFGVCD